MPKVSVIIPVYNAEKFLCDCINSVRSQTLNDIEIICVDDGSTDTSVDVLKKFKDCDSRIQIFCQDHKYAGAARNLGLEHAAGDYVIFMDADDLYPNNDALKVLYDHAVLHNVDICGGSRVHLRDGKIVKPIWNEKEFFIIDGLMRFSDYQFDFNHQRYLFKRAFINKNGLRYRDYARFQDAPFLLEAMVCAKSFYAVKHDVYCYRRGHKDTHWNARSVNDWLKGLTENLTRSRDEGLPELHDRVAQRIFNVDYIKIIARSVSEGNQEVMDLLDRFIKNINLGMVCFKRYNNADELKKDYLNMLYKEKIVLGISAPKVSVVIPSYNVKKYIRECLDSVLNQTVQDIEIICVDDDSSDGTLEILREYAKKDGRFIVKSKEHEGVSSCRNMALDMARGEYIYFLDSDDYIASNTLELLYSTAVSYDLEVLYFDGLAVFEEETFKTRKMHETVYIKQCPKSGVLTGQQLLTHFTGVNFRIHMCMQFFKLKFLKDTGIRCYPGIIHQDELFTSMCITVASRVQYIKDILYFRRLRENSTITALDKEHSFFSMMTVIAEFLRFMDTIAIEPAAKNVLALKMKTWVDRAIIRYCEIHSKIDVDKMFSDDKLKHHIFFTAVLPQISIKKLYRTANNTEEEYLRRSAFFKIGRIITFFPRKIKKWVKRG